MAPKKLSLSDKFANLITPAPLQVPEDDDIQGDTAAQVVDFDDESEEEGETVISKLRRQNAEVIGLVDGRYAGEKISRKALEDDSDEDVSDDTGEQAAESSEDDSDALSEKGKESLDSMDMEQSENEGEEDGDAESLESKEGSELEEEKVSDIDSADGSLVDEESDGDMFPDEEAGVQQEEVEETQNFKHFSNVDKNTEVQKGNAVRNQLNVWDGILEFRIQVQKCLVSANQLPSFEKINSFKSEGGKEFSSAQSYCVKKSSNLLEKLLELQNAFLKQNPETKNILSSSKSQKPTSKDPDDEEITSSEDEKEVEEKEEEKEKRPAKKRKLEDFSEELAKIQSTFVGYRNTTIQKWNDKTRVAQGKLNSKNFSAFEQSTLKQIEQVLADKQRLLKRSRMKRSGYRILGEPEKEVEKDKEEEESDKIQEFNCEIFDDDDFYHQLLRELIEHKSEGVTDPVQLGRQWIALQKLRSKMKRKIDTRATKGRKIRYTVHPKLVNFMAPFDKCTWNEESKTELFNSLFAP